jgi:hypothetical protein
MCQSVLLIANSVEFSQLVHLVTTFLHFSSSKEAMIFLRAPIIYVTVMSQSATQNSGSGPGQSSHSASTQDAPFAQQFNYHLQNLAIVPRSGPPKPDGKVTVHLPDYTSVLIDYNRRETIESLRLRLQGVATNYRIDDYYLVSSHGSIEDQMTLDEYFLIPGSDLVLVRKGVKNRQQLANRNFWLKSREAVTSGKRRPTTVLSEAAPARKRHTITPYREARLERSVFD